MSRRATKVKEEIASSSSYARCSRFLPFRCAQASRRRRPQFRVTGLGWQDNRMAHSTLTALLGGKPRATFDANNIEDAALIVFSQQTEEGYLKARITAGLKLPDGNMASYPLDARLDQPLPRPLEATEVTLKVERGPRFVLQEITFTGLQALPEDEARNYFAGESLLITIDADRIYLPGRLARSAANLQIELQRRGYAEAAVTTDQLQVDEATGRTRVRVVVQEGPLWQVKVLNIDVADGGEAPPGFAAARAGAPWSSQWRQDTQAALRSWYYERGYPDVQVRIDPAAAEPADGKREVTVTAAITPGQRSGSDRFASAATPTPANR